MVVGDELLQPRLVDRGHRRVRRGTNVKPRTGTGVATRSREEVWWAMQTALTLAFQSKGLGKGKRGLDSRREGVSRTVGLVLG